MINLLSLVKHWFSNIKWILISLKPLIVNVENRYTCLFYFLFPFHRKPLKMKFREGFILFVPASYVYEAVAETLLFNAYEFNHMCGVAVDIGASIGDFTILASRKSYVVYAFEPDPNSFQYLQKNIVANKLVNVHAFNTYATSGTLEKLLTCKVDRIDFLKIDCEGCEYEIILNCKNETLSKISRIAMEIHEPPLCTNYTQRTLITKLSNAGFRIRQRKLYGGYYVYALRS